MGSDLHVLNGRGMPIKSTSPRRSCIFHRRGICSRGVRGWDCPAPHVTSDLYVLNWAPYGTQLALSSSSREVSASAADVGAEAREAGDSSRVVSNNTARSTKKDINMTKPIANPELPPPPAGKYPAKNHARRVAKWIAENGGPKSGVIYLEGQLMKMTEVATPALPVSPWTRGQGCIADAYYRMMTKRLTSGG